MTTISVEFSNSGLCSCATFDYNNYNISIKYSPDDCSLAFTLPSSLCTGISSSLEQIRLSSSCTSFCVPKVQD